MPIRVVQWTTGNVGRQAVQAMATNPELDLVGCYAWSSDKVGVDVGELCGTDPLGIVATDDADALLALRPDCVLYAPMWLDVDEMVRILEAGVNIASTASFVTGHSLGADRDRIVAACERGGSSIFGSGINPGFADLMAIASASVCDRIDKITVSESADATGYDSPATELPVGFKQPIDHPDLPEMTRQGTAIFEDVVRLVADAIGVELDEVVCEPEYAVTTEDVPMGSWTIEAGNVAGIAASWQGRVDGRTVVDLRFRWRKGRTLDPDWQIDDSYVITVEGRPTVTTKISILPPPDFHGETLGDFMVLGMIMTAMPAVNAIPAVVAASPGIVTYTDVVPMPRGWVPGTARS